MKWRIWLLFVCITVASAVLFGVGAARVRYKSTVEDGKVYLRTYMNAYDSDDYSFDREGAVAFSEKLNGVRVTFALADGGVVADSAADNIIENHADRQEFIDAAQSGEGYDVRSSSTLGKRMLYYCKSVGDGKLVRIAIFVDSDWLSFFKVLPSIIPFVAVMALACVLATVLTTNFIVAPVKDLAKEAVDGEMVTSEFDELKPIANILNERNRNLRLQMEVIKTEKKEIERARESKDEFISNVTHEMNTPLTSIRGYAELLSVGGLAEEQKTVAYKTIAAQSERLANLIACIINYSAIDSDDLPSYDVDFSSLAREILQALEPEARERNVEIIEKIDDGVVLSSRAERLSEAFGNLTRNALKYNKDGGRVVVTLTKDYLSVEDTGIGISEENKRKIFSRFFTVDKSRGGKNGGFGLGLAVVKKICVKSGWEISVESKLGEGSSFTINFNPQKKK